MIEVLVSERCLACNMCVKVCPMNVFDTVPGGSPVIARQGDCQTCYMCELYCPSHALYVAPFVGKLQGLDSDALEARGLFGSYQAALGWTDSRPGGTEHDTSCHTFEQIRHASFELAAPAAGGAPDRAASQKAVFPPEGS
jgi:NAD-dependent dihydropyrimidine dehydrogenase PreA subunit